MQIHTLQCLCWNDILCSPSLKAVCFEVSNVKRKENQEGVLLEVNNLLFSSVEQYVPYNNSTEGMSYLLQNSLLSVIDSYSESQTDQEVFNPKEEIQQRKNCCEDTIGMQIAHSNLKFIFCNKTEFQQKYIWLVGPVCWRLQIGSFGCGSRGKPQSQGPNYIQTWLQHVQTWKLRTKSTAVWWSII